MSTDSPREGRALSPSNSPRLDRSFQSPLLGALGAVETALGPVSPVYFAAGLGVWVLTLEAPNVPTATWTRPSNIVKEPQAGWRPRSRLHGVPWEGSQVQASCRVLGVFTEQQVWRARAQQPLPTTLPALLQHETMQEPGIG